MSNNLEQDIKELTREELERLLLEQTEQVDYCYKRIEELEQLGLTENGIICEKNKKISELQQRIDKAIEYINKEHKLIDLNTGEKTYTKYGKDLLEILGDKENETK